MDHISLMRSFAAVAQVGSFNGAAKILNFSGSVVSRHVGELERQLGVQLVHRTARSVSLTQSGKRYAEFATRILDEMDEERASISQTHELVEGGLSVMAPKWIGSLDLGDAMAAFSMEFPKLSVRFELGGLSHRTYNFLESGFDVALQTRELRDSSVRLRKITSVPFVLCASKAYIERNGAPTRPDELSEHECLVHSNDPVWRLGSGPAAAPIRIRNTLFSSNSHLALHKAALFGRGIALLPERAVYDDLVSGKLQVLFPELGVTDRSLYAIYGPGDAVPRKVSALLDFLTAWFRENPMPTLQTDAAP
ncbi:LysR family transcriptional regulator [Streptomyces sp. NPDC059785]|uniref:LysR family transcriptional regulator n=1 Tax=Streptomyces sp. NPDC059785 TaxID=3346945 RepID=UPI00364A4FD1